MLQAWVNFFLLHVQFILRSTTQHCSSIVQRENGDAHLKENLNSNIYQPSPVKMDDTLKTLADQTSILYADPHNPHHHLSRGRTHQCLGFPDLAAADAYRALSLLDSVVDPEGCEFHARRVRDPATRAHDGDDDDDEDETEEITQDEYNSLIGPVYGLLVTTLVKCGCLRDAYDFCTRALSGLSREDPNIKILQDQMEIIKKAYIARREARDDTASIGKDSTDIDASVLPAQGFARRVLYPWNTHEPDRKAPETLALLNERLKDVAPRCEVRAVALPALQNQRSSHDISEHDDEEKKKKKKGEVSIQLGLFAREDIPAGDIILRESSMLTATNRLHDDLCDACNSPLPSLSSGTETRDDEGAKRPVSCENCDDTIFCSIKCHDKAQETYHGAVCENLEGLESIGKDIHDARDKADYLYLLLLERSLAMAATQDVHPLDLPEVKYIWGDFHDYSPNPSPNSDSDTNDNSETANLPFSFHLNILQPMRIVEEMALDPYESLPRYDTWVLNTLYAKFRGTASGRLSTWDGGPELCAVHPLWCLANHSCDPNVRWEWGGEITFSVRATEEKPTWVRRGRGEMRVPVSEPGERKLGIRKDEEILNHYCDIGLDVKERRGWARGALGGMCLCPRCVWEST